MWLLQDKKKDAVKKVIAAMTVGKDVSMLFTDVVNCMQTENLELKKLVYLYLINYAKSHPDLAILAVNTFVKVRTYFSSQVHKFIEQDCVCRKLVVSGSGKPWGISSTHTIWIIWGITINY
jgi:hypothetical protein